MVLLRLVARYGDVYINPLPSTFYSSSDPLLIHRENKNDEASCSCVAPVFSVFQNEKTKSACLLPPFLDFENKIDSYHEPSKVSPKIAYNQLMTAIEVLQEHFTQSKSSTYRKPVASFPCLELLAGVHNIKESCSSALQ